MSHDPQPAGSPIPLRIIAVPHNGPIVCCFSSSIEGVLTHWPHGHSQLCPGEDECPRSTHSGKTVWKGFAAGWAWQRLDRCWTPGVLEITEVLEESLRGRDLTGEVYLLERRGKGRKNDPVCAQLLETRTELELCTPFNIRLCVERSYHTTHVRWGIRNPLPARTMVAAIQVRGPRAPDRAQPVETVPEPRATAADLARLRAASSAAAEARPTSPPATGPEPSGNGKVH